MKIPDEILGMSRDKRRKWVKAIDEVYERYKKSTNFNSCPFCSVIPAYNCDDCLWMMIEKETCMNFACEKTGYVVPEPDEESYNEWKRIRYPMLRKWRRMLVEAGI